MPKKKPKINGFELPYDFDTVEELNAWVNSSDGAQALQDYFKSEIDNQNYGPFFIEF